MGEKISVADILFMSCLDAAAHYELALPDWLRDYRVRMRARPRLCGDLSAQLRRAQRSGGLNHARPARRHPRPRPDDHGLGPGGDHDARRPGRRRDQDRGAGRRHHAPVRCRPPRHVRHLPVLQPLETLALRRPQVRRGTRHRAQARRDRRRAGAELPPRHDRAHGAQRESRSRTQVRHHLRLDQRLRRVRPLCAPAGLRFGHPGPLRALRHPDRQRDRAARTWCAPSFPTRRHR